MQNYFYYKCTLWTNSMRFYLKPAFPRSTIKRKNPLY